MLWLATLAMRPLFNTDEGRYAEIPREMLQGGDWVIPHLNGLSYIEKPPLQYWATALCLQLFGSTEFAARLYVGLTALCTIVVVWWVASRLWDRDTAWRAAAILASLLLFLVLGQLLTLDMSLTFYLTLSLAGFLLAQRPALVVGGGASFRASRGAARGWMLLAWVATALGVLTKGLVAAAIPVAVLVVYTLSARDFAPWRRLYLAVGLPIFLVITVPWHWLAARRLADFLEFFFVHEHMARFLTPIADRQEAWWFFIAVFVAGSLPWTLPALRVLTTGWRRRVPAGGFNAPLFLWLWIAFVIGFYSLSDSKLIPYVLPAMPALALLIATLPPALLRRDIKWTAVLTLILALALVLASLYWPRLIASFDRRAYFLPLARPLLQIALLLAVSGIYVLVQRNCELTRAAVILGIGWCLSWLLLVRAAAIVAPIYSGAGLAAALPAAERAALVYSVGTYDQTLPFYWRRTVRLVAYRGELAYGLRHQPDAESVTLEEFLKSWTTDRKAYAVMERSMFDKLKERGVAMREISRDAQRVLVARR